MSTLSNSTGTKSSRARQAARFRALLNDLKRNEESAAIELGEERTLIRDILLGKKPLPSRVIKKAARRWPINERDFYVLTADASDGVIVMTGEASRQSARTIERGEIGYYEYRDLAMTRMSSIRPEWIRMLHTVDDSDAYNPTIKWNKGHLLYQFTYFCGDINYYYEWKGKKFCAEMTTGDSVFGLPYSPHSFANRKGGKPGYILALTFSGRVGGEMQDQISLMPATLLPDMMPGNENGYQLVGRLIQTYADNCGIPLETLAKMMGWTSQELDEVLRADADLSLKQLETLALHLKVPVRELLPPANDTNRGIVIQRQSNSARWAGGTGDTAQFQVRQLASSALVPYMRAIELDLTEKPAHLRPCQLHTFVYNLGPSDVELSWTWGKSRKAILAPAASSIILPYISYSFSAVSSTEGRVLIMRASPQLTGDAYLEACVLGPQVLSRMHNDLQRWY